MTWRELTAKRRGERKSHPTRRRAYRVPSTQSQRQPLTVSTYILLVLAIVLLNVASAIAVAWYAARKGFPFVPILLAAVVISFPIVWLVVALLPPRDEINR